MKIIYHNVSIRLEASEKEKLVKKYGGVQAAVDYLITSLENEKPRTPKNLERIINQAQKELDDWILENVKA